MTQLKSGLVSCLLIHAFNSWSSFDTGSAAPAKHLIHLLSLVTVSVHAEHSETGLSEDRPITWRSASASDCNLLEREGMPTTILRTHMCPLATLMYHWHDIVPR
ncbi:hypothetical protein BJ741DRAFT_585553 [Chytriomyces cf. hyalinus JEL632]|nr:hypothetical protein BJ741DRAFT_585553 [Chytriomyces cf. hyalinus JEL632]